MLKHFYNKKIGSSLIGKNANFFTTPISMKTLIVFPANGLNIAFEFVIVYRRIII